MIDTALRMNLGMDYTHEFMITMIFTKDGVNNSVEVPELFYTIHQNLVFLEKNNIETVQDFLDWLNSKGYNSRIHSELVIYGYTYNGSVWDYEYDKTMPMVAAEVNKSNFPCEDKVTQFRTAKYNEDKAGTVLVFDEVPILNFGRTARWRREVQSYRFTPERLEYNTLPKESTKMYFGRAF